MPGLDGTGPMGLGPMTGRGLGWCRFYYGGYSPGFWRGWFPGWGWGFGRGFGLGMGWRWRRGWGWGRRFWPPFWW